MEKIKKVSHEEAKRLKRLQKQREIDEKNYHRKKQKILLKHQYISALVWHRYFLARYNMLAAQLINKQKLKIEITETLDGVRKTEQFVAAEAALFKLRAIEKKRESNHAKKELQENFKLTDTDIEEIERIYYDGRIVRESYEDDDDYQSGKAVFVDE